MAIRLLLVLLALFAALDGSAREAETGIGIVPLGALPREAQIVLQRIDAGGPFAYRKDGSVFGNRERLLPLRPTGYYREYTVPTPGSSDRGARRIVKGAAGELFYTRDHYRSFKRIVQ